MKSHGFNLLWVLLISYALGAVLFPQRFIFFSPSFLDYWDSNLSYAGAFYVTNSLFHGGIQLWDRYDQMPITFFNLNFGMYKLSNILTALAYAAAVPFSDQPAKLFHVIFSFMFTFSTLCIRSVGDYLLLSLFIQRRWMLILATVYGAVVLSPQFMTGLSTNIIYSLFPLMMYFLLRFAKELKFEFVFFLAITWLYCIATDVFCGLGYLYQALHFIVLPSLVWGILRHREKLRNLKWPSFWALWTPVKTKKTLVLLALAVAMLLPTAWLVKSNYHDYDFGLENSRFKDPWSVTAYFQRPVAWAKQSEFLLKSFDATHEEWAWNWLYLGAGALFFAVLGFLVMRDSRRWILGAGVVFFFLMNSPRISEGLSGLAHWINALTNPLKFLPRSMGMSFAYLLPFVLLPLIVTGFCWCWERLVERKGEKKDMGVLAVSAIVFLVVAVAVFKPLPAASRQLFLCTGVAVAALIGVYQLSLRLHRGQASAAAALGLLLVGLIVVDAWGMSSYIRLNLSGAMVRPRMVAARPDVGSVHMDYQNPRILPVREYYALMPPGDKDKYLFQQPYNMPGIIFRYTNHLRYYQEVSNYLPRHVAFSGWYSGGLSMLYYLKGAPRMMFLASAAMADEGSNFQRIIERGLQHDVAVVEGYQGPLLAVVPDIAPSLLPQIPVKETIIPWDQISLKQDQGLGSFATPTDLPTYYASAFLTPDEDLFRMAVLGPPAQLLKVAQGQVITPLTFDVNNAREGRVTVGLPKDLVTAGAGIAFVYPVAGPEGLTGVTQNNMDDLGFSYTARHDGWLVIHQPFDAKWRILVDGQKVPFYKTNRSFIGLPLSSGAHTILLRYWPDTPLRFLLGLSIAVCTAVLLWILIAALRRNGL